jgi:hypothetical protein
MLSKEVSGMSKKRTNIEQHEADILKDFEARNFVSVENNQEEMAMAKKAADNYTKGDKGSIFSGS